MVCTPCVTPILLSSMLSPWLERKSSFKDNLKQHLFCTWKGFVVTLHTMSHVGRGCQCEESVRSGHALQLSWLLGALTGLGAVASYGAISNVTYGGGLAVAWIAFVR